MANEMDFLRYAYSPPRTFMTRTIMKRTAGLLPSYQFPQEVMYDEPGIEPGIAYSTADMMPPAQQMPAAVPPPATFAPRPNPLLDESLYTPTPRPVQQPLDFSRFPYPEAPRYRMPGAAPARDLGMERGFTQQRSLRAALLGALLGGGTGAIAGLTGAQQGAQQAFEQDYAQRMADYQNQARLMDIENQQLAAADQRAIAMRNTQVGEALKAYAMEGERLDAEYKAAEAVRQLKVERARAIAENDKARVDSVDSILKGLLDVAPEDQLAYIQARVTGQLPATPIRPAPKAVTSTTGSMAAQMYRDLMGIASRLTDAEYTDRRNRMIASPDPNVQQAGLMTPETRPRTAATLPAAALDVRVKAGERKESREERLLKLREKAERRMQEYQTGKTAIDKERLALDRTREARLAKPKAQKPDSTEISQIRKSFDSIVKLISKGIQDARKPEFKFVQQTRDQLNQDMAGLRQQLRDMEANYSGVIKIDNIESGLPTLRIIGQGTPRPQNPPGRQPNPPAGQGGNFTEVVMPDGTKVRYRLKR